jgi:Uma2 family endonuclease
MKEVFAVFEVLFPTPIKDKVIKKRLYECAGAREYFLILLEKSMN